MAAENEMRPGGNRSASNEDQPLDKCGSTSSAILADFLCAIFGDSLNGFIEVRLFRDDKKDAPIVARDWYPDTASLIGALPRLLATAKPNNAGIFFGVLVRRARGHGKATDVRSGRVLWCDIDFKDFPGGEAEARARLASFASPPSIIVRSGGGLHCYWLLSELADPVAIENANKQFVGALGADKAWDRARVLRLPSSYHRKDPANPRLVEVELFEPSKIYDIADIAGADAEAFEPAETDVADIDEAGEWDGSLASLNAEILCAGISDAVQRLLSSVKKVNDAFMGRGKPEKTSNGKSLDCSSSGYDFTLVRQLVSHGISDPVELAVALARRPDGYAAKKGLAYIRTTIKNVLDLVARERAAATGDPIGQLDFVVEKVVIFMSIPPAYVFVIDGVELRLDVGDLVSRNTFAQRFLEALHRIPNLPDQRQCPWTVLVNGWLRNAERVEQPPETSTEGALRDAVARAIAALPVGDDASDLDRANGIVLADGRTAFRMNSVLAAVLQEIPDARRNHVGRVLRELGFEPGSHRLDSGVERLWCGSVTRSQNTREGEGT